jgi:hypothetical protein
MRWMEACYGGTDVMERSCAVVRGKDISSYVLSIAHENSYLYGTFNVMGRGRWPKPTALFLKRLLITNVSKPPLFLNGLLIINGAKPPTPQAGNGTILIGSERAQTKTFIFINL